jgi:protein-glucosylgalactosylhydroxylysine glucosidase
MKRTNYLILAGLCLSAWFNVNAQKTVTKIDRKAVVERHKVINTKADPLSSLTVGNGRFAFTVDVTGLQTFPEYYEKGVPLGTQSEWGWHSFKDTAGYKFEESLKNYHINGRDISYGVQIKEPKRANDAGNWFRENPHRLQLGNLGLLILKKDGSEAGVDDIKNIRQELNPWTGEIKSHFTVEGETVDVVTYGHQEKDAVAAQIVSDLVKEGRLKVKLRFPYPTNQFTDMGVNYKDADKHTSAIDVITGNKAGVSHTLDNTRYWLELEWSGKASLTKIKAHEFLLSPDKANNVLTIGCRFNHYPQKALFGVNFEETKNSSITEWKKYWMRGGAVDFSGSTDKRAFELERRIILSQYLLKAQEAGQYPPQETGLTYNSWYGKPHLEMHYWHDVHYPLWGREDLQERSMGWYKAIEPKAKAIAQRQGFKGVRWPKMTDNTGDESPSSVGAFLIWQQPHYIYMAELDYRAHPTKETLLKYKDLVFADADFMASYAYFDKATNRYILGPGLIPSQEVHNQAITINPPYELTYWNLTLNIAQQWRQRLGLPRNKEWDNVINKLSPLPQQNGVYLAAESAPDSYTNPKNKTDHPSQLAAYGMMPYTKMMDTAVMHKTFNLIWTDWTWSHTWGWDFPMTAMAATRLNLPAKAIDALFMPVMTNTYLNNGHNYQDDRLTIYLPGNGGLLTAVAMMCAGWDGCKIQNPGFPKDGTWKVKWEGLRKMP